MRFIKLREGLAEHWEQGKISPLEYAVYVYILTKCDYRTGVWQGSARQLSFNIGIPERAARHTLESLEGKRYLKRFATPGRHQNYPILIDKHFVEHNGEQDWRTNAFKTRDWRKPYIEKGQQFVEQFVQHTGQQGGEHRGQHSGQQSAPYQEVIIQNKDLRTTPPPPVENLIVSTMEIERDPSALSWEAFEVIADIFREVQRQEPVFVTADIPKIENVFRVKSDLTVQEFGRRFRVMLASGRFKPLKFFCQDFDEYMEPKANGKTAYLDTRNTGNDANKATGADRPDAGGINVYVAEFERRTALSRMQNAAKRETSG